MITLCGSFLNNTILYVKFSVYKNITEKQFIREKGDFMKYIEYREKREHGTKEFPVAFYRVTEIHPRYNMILHWHNECELIYIRSGSLELTVDGNTRTLCEGESALIIGGSMHGGTPTDCNYDCIVFDISAFLRPGRCSAAMQSLINHEKRPAPFFEKGSEQSVYAKQACDALAYKETGYEFYLHGQLMCLFGSILRGNCYSSEKELPAGDIKKIRKFKKVLQYIEQHYREPLTLEDLARQCDMNRNYFCRAFKEYTQKTPMEYLNFYRIESACEKIVSTDEKLLDIAMSCGFSDYSYFIKVFKSQKGVTPRNYSRKNF